MTDKKARETEVKQILARVPKELHREIRMQAAASDRPLNEIVNEALQQWLDRQKTQEAQGQ